MPKKILVADDSITIQKVVELTFSDGDYIVIPTSNGAKAIQKLSEVRPDIILSDIIMPEKNGYEVCEYVKSHPDFRSIPVILLTGTFEPFDPDRAEKAGCDAVVTKPFESQSLILKVEELLARSAGSVASSAPSSNSAIPEAVATMPRPTVSQWEPASAPDATEPESPFASTPGANDSSPSAAPESSAAALSFALEDDPFAPSPASSSGPAPIHGTDLFTESGGETQPTDPLPFEQPAPMLSGGETRAFPKMSFQELQAMAGLPQSDSPSLNPPVSESPWADSTATESPFGSADTAKAFVAPSQPESQDAQLASTPDPEPAYSGETRAFPRMTLEDLQRMDREASAASPSEPVNTWKSAPPIAMPDWNVAAHSEAAEEADSGFSSAAAPATEPPPALPELSDDSSWSDGSAPAVASEPDAGEWSPSSATAESVAGDWAAPSAEMESDAAGSSMFPEASGSAAAEWSPASQATESDVAEPYSSSEPFASTVSESEPLSFPQETGSAAVLERGGDGPFPPQVASVSSGSESSVALTSEQVDRIARRVVELMSEELVRNIAWEVIPDMAEMFVKERIRELEAEA